MKLIVVALALFLGAAAAFQSSAFNGRQLVEKVSASSTMTMKIFDWKRRGETPIAADAGIEYTVTNIQPAPGSRKRKTRKGRGISAGQGASCGFGMRGQRSRAGRPVRSGFEGGQTPLYRRIPKLRGKPMGPGHTREEFALLKFDHLNKAAEGSVVSPSSLLEAGVTSKDKFNVFKVVGGGADLSVKGLTVQAHAFTESAKAAIEAAGGKCVLLSKTTNQPLEA